MRYEGRFVHNRRLPQPGATAVVGQPGYAPVRSISDGDDPCPFCGGYEVYVSRVRECVHGAPWFDRRDSKEACEGWNDVIVHECARCHATLTLHVEEL